MKDLIITCKDKQGKRVKFEYDTIMDFTDKVEAGTANMDYTDINAMFFENELNTKSCSTLKELYQHCCNIISV